MKRHCAPCWWRLRCGRGCAHLSIGNVLAQKAAWGLVLASAVAMPLLMPLAARWNLTPKGAALVVPARAFDLLKGIGSQKSASGEAQRAEARSAVADGVASFFGSGGDVCAVEACCANESTSRSCARRCKPVSGARDFILRSCCASRNRSTSAGSGAIGPRPRRCSPKHRVAPSRRPWRVWRFTWPWRRGWCCGSWWGSLRPFACGCRRGAGVDGRDAEPGGGHAPADKQPGFLAGNDWVGGGAAGRFRRVGRRKAAHCSGA